ncbi:MAG: ABC transporter substrate-binding protein [Oscillospiraceae bacterium]|nr:ABC transporter substrate-binding protein [Oscillospiraceae bacterium]
MKKVSKLVALGLAGCLAASVCAGCGSNNASSGESKKEEAAKGKVYYLNFKPEQDEQWQSLAKAYTEETGVNVQVVTAAEGTYEQTLTSEMDKSDAPTLFQVNGPVGLANWKDYCYDLKDSDLYKQVTSDDFVLKEGDSVYGVAYVVETYGIIYNKTLLNKYFESDFATVKSADEINNFDKLKTVAEEIQANKDTLGVDGAFTSAGMDASSDWRFKTHLANMPIYYEYKDKGISSTDAIEGKYLDNYKQIWDLYINNATCDKTALASKTGTDAETEFKTGKAVFFQNGTWEYDGCKYNEETKDGLKDEEFGMRPIYIGVSGEEKQGLCTGSENYWCVNKNASEDDIKATLDFVNWCVTNDKGTKALADDMGFVIPFKAAKEATNPLVAIANQYVSDGKEPVSWNFSSIPSETWKNGVGTALTQYAAGTGDWNAVVTAFVDGWKTEYAAANK